MEMLIDWFFTPTSPTAPFTLAAGFASIGGLIYSIRAFSEAKTAAAAATEAKNSILSKNALEELEHTCNKLDQVRDFVGHDKLPEALLRTS